MSINFKCPSCSHELEAETSMGGEIFDCPSCGKAVNVPAARTFSKPSPLKTLEGAADGQTKILAALLDESARQTKQLDSIRRMILWFYLSALLAAILAVIEWILRSI